jgi:DNA-binding MarR family transcriptional regulator
MRLDETSGADEPADTMVASRVARQILLSAREFERRFDHWLAEHNLNLTRVEVLACLAAHGESGCSQTDLATALQLSESNVCTLIERMRSDGWLFRLRSDVDRRRSVVMLSPQGRQALAEIEQLRRRRIRHWLNDMTGQELEQLNVLLDRVLTDLRQNAPLKGPQAAQEMVPFEPLRRAS